MLFSNRRRKQSGRFAPISRLRFYALFFFALTQVSNAAEINTLRIESEPGQPFLAQLPIDHAHPNTDLSCFTLQQPPDIDPIQLEYTTLGSQQGILMLWSSSSITGPLTFTLTDHCLPGKHTFTIEADNTASLLAPAVITQVTPVVPPKVAPNSTSSPPAMTTELPAATPPDIPAEAYDALQQQIDALQTDFKQLQRKSDVLYASNLAQEIILGTLKQQLTQLQNENHLLRTLVLTLSLALIISGYFFADWLRRYAAAPKAPKVRDKAKQSSSPTQPGQSIQPHTNTPQSPQSPQEITGSHPAPHTQSPYQPATRPPGRLQPVPLHANDDAVSPTGTPQRISSQHSTNAVMQDASRLFTHGRINQAIEHLQQHLAKHPKCSPWMWLYLLDLLSKEGKQQEFDIVAGDCRKHFNLSVERNPDFKQQGIESYPRIMKALQQTWGTPQVISLIDDLVYNTRLVPRMGFERSVFEEMMMLKEIACQTQNLPTSQPVAKPSADADSMQENLRELQKLSGDIYVLAPVDQTPFQYWTDFTFELDESSTVRRSA